MIRDLIIITNSGVHLFHQNFGECHSFGTNPDLLSGLMTSIQMLSESISGETIQLIKMVDKNLAFHKSALITYAVVCDLTDEFKDIEFKIKRISEIFEQKYEFQLTKFTGEVTIFENFGDILIEMNITQKNCGGRPECEGCDNSKKTLPISKIIKSIKKRRLKIKFLSQKRKEKEIKRKIKKIN
ncbi:MAG: hypothetical protein GY870_09330 [archaeon]|nr:hypothetical protein [archaeon]